MRRGEERRRGRGGGCGGRRGQGGRGERRRGEGQMRGKGGGVVLFDNSQTLL